VVRRIDVVADGPDQLIEAVLGPREHDPPWPQGLDPELLTGLDPASASTATGIVA